jgi:hypothetical protein
MLKAKQNYFYNHNKVEMKKVQYVHNLPPFTNVGDAKYSISIIIAIVSASRSTKPVWRRRVSFSSGGLACRGEAQMNDILYLALAQGSQPNANQGYIYYFRHVEPRGKKKKKKKRSASPRISNSGEKPNRASNTSQAQFPSPIRHV